MKRITTHTAFRSISLVLIVSMAMAQVGSFPATCAAGTPSDDLKEIQYRYYFRGKYDQAIDMLQTYLARTDLDPSSTRSAREFLAASFVLSGSPEKGREIFVQMLNEDAAYSGPDTSTFRAEVVTAWSEARDMYASNRLKSPPPVETVLGAEPASGGKEGKPIYKKWWFYVAGAATLLLIAGAVTSEEKDDPVAHDTGTVNVGVQVR
jgi:hypothetical protein